ATMRSPEKETELNQLENVTLLPLDVTNIQQIETTVKAAIHLRDIDVVFNNAGYGLVGSLESYTEEQIRSQFETNFFGVIEVTQAFIDLLKVAEQPRIVNVTSGLGSITLHNDPSWRYYQVKAAAYFPSKAALNAYSTVLAYDLRDTAFKVNVVDPGYTATDFNHHSGPGTVEDAAARVVKAAVLGADGPTGQFFSDDNSPETGISPW
ncbi:MAG: SDR family NAD(P)-dependent oxidoreductase, partial [Pedobacter sp.]|uniref:SDR family NAD(P)-dependent oxidoreductase n=1 Tax=Pedobacter sp. TaxID=1411316 RepID=UPI003392BFA0